MKKIPVYLANETDFSDSFFVVYATTLSLSLSLVRDAVVHSIVVIVDDRSTSTKPRASSGNEVTDT